MPSLNVRVHILEARELKGVDSGGTCDPIVVVSCMGKKDQTDVYPKVRRPNAMRHAARSGALCSRSQRQMFSHNALIHSPLPAHWHPRLTAPAGPLRVAASERWQLTLRHTNLQHITTHHHTLHCDTLPRTAVGGAAAVWAVCENSSSKLGWREQ